MCNLYRIFLVLLIGIPSVNLANEYTEYKSELDKHIKSTKEATVFYKSKAMITDETDRNNIFIIKNSDLNNAGRDFLTYLENNQKVYQQLSFDDWLKASYDLLKFDEWISQEKAWGNLVIKIAICNTILHQLWEHLGDNNQLTEDSVLKLIRLQDELRRHLPVKTEMYEIALRHYGFIDKMNGASFKIDKPVRTDVSDAGKYLYNLTNDASEFNRKLEQILVKEGNVVIKSYIDLYDSPVPLTTGYFSQYFSIIWNTYLYTLLLQDIIIEDSLWVDLKEVKVDTILRRLYETEERFWMPDSVLFYLEQPTGGSYIERQILTKEFLSDIMQFSKNSEDRKNNNSNAIKFLPHIAL